MNKQVDDDGISSKNGLGDITVLGQYQVFNKVKMNTKKHSSSTTTVVAGRQVLNCQPAFLVLNALDSTTTLADIKCTTGKPAALMFCSIACIACVPAILDVNVKREL